VLRRATSRASRRVTPDENPGSLGYEAGLLEGGPARSPRMGAVDPDPVDHDSDLREPGLSAPWSAVSRGWMTRVAA
jgi:hypothetical protein